MASEQARPHRPITAHLIEGGAVTPDQVDVALARQRETGRRIGESLVELGFVSEEDIGWALARQLDIPFVDVRPEIVDLDLVRSFPEGALRRLQAVPLFRTEAGVTAAVADPTDGEAMRELERLCAAPTSCVAATPSSIERALEVILGRAGRTRAREAEPGAAPGAVVWDRSGESFLGFHLRQAACDGVDEVQFACAEGSLEVRHRAGTRLVPVASEPAAVADVLLARLEALGMQPLAGEDGHRSFTATCVVGAATRDVHVSALASRSGVSVVVRLLRDPARPAALDSLGLEPLDVAQLRETLLAPSGVVIVAAPPGSGGSTTLGALLAEIPTDDRLWALFCADPRRRPAAPGRAEIVTGPAAARWPRIACAHALDGIVVDGGLEGARVRRLAHRATRGRWVLARTDWEDTFEMLEWLTRAPGGRALVGRRLLAVLQQRLVATPAANAAPAGAARPRGAAPPGSAPPRRAVFEVLHVDERLRAGVFAGASAAGLRALAGGSGFRPLADQLRDGVQRGRLDARDAGRAQA